MDTVIRAAKAKDLKQVSKLGKIKEFGKYIEDYFNTNYVKKYLHPDYFLVLEKKKKIIGFLIAEELLADGVLLWYLAIKYNMRGRGYGEKLLTEFENRCRKNKAEWIILYCPQKSKNAIKLYKRKEYFLNIKYLEFEKYLC